MLIEHLDPSLSICQSSQQMYKVQMYKVGNITVYILQIRKLSNLPNYPAS